MNRHELKRCLPGPSVGTKLASAAALRAYAALEVYKKEEGKGALLGLRS